ncbi:MAG TPA: TIGR00282 family metallophosphoesterase [Candidatus Cryosericum sp.]|nr:TIGR00282 family metallophosphoesterase [Candidatus Cryosericum sp.]
MNILFVGDVFGRPGRDAVKKLLPGIRQEFAPALVIANGENATHGTAMTQPAYEELTAAGVDVFTGGNHTLGKKESLDLMALHANVLCPGNISPAVRSHGFGVFSTPDGSVAVINAMGQYCMNGVDSPFHYLEELLEYQDVAGAAVRVLDFHAEATAEKAAMLCLTDGRLSAVIGTHTHVPTADARVTPRGTAFISDVGMTGVQSSIIGLDPAVMLEHFRTGVTQHPKVAAGDAVLMAVVVDVDTETGLSRSITPLIRNA